MLKIKEAIVVEGRYDKNTLSQIVDTVVFETSGFGIRNDKQQMNLLRQVAQTRGLIVFTDSDGAGFVIRNFIKGAISSKYLKHAYIPDIFGKERRKRIPGKEGKIGVEGMPTDIIIGCLRDSGATFLDLDKEITGGKFTKQDLFDLGLSGCSNSSLLRKMLLKHLDLPERMSTNAMVDALSILYTKDDIIRFLSELNITHDLGDKE